MIATTDATKIVAILAAFFLLLALIAVARAMFTRNPPTARRFRVGVFVERDHEAQPDDTPPKGDS